MDSEGAVALQEQVDAVPYWHHTIDLGHGVITPGGGGDTSHGLRRIGLPEDLSGKTVIDIGAWDGFYSFECERRGASRVVAADLYVWRQPEFGKTGFEVARRALGSGVEDREIDVFDISPATVGTFDVVLFLGVLYHLRDPYGGLAHAASVARDLLIVETHVDFLDQPRPAVAFYPRAELAGDATNWCGPNVPALVAMLGTLGFSEVELVTLEPQVGDDEWLRTTGDGSGSQGTRRAVVHARRSLSGLSSLPAAEGADDTHPDRAEPAAESDVEKESAPNDDVYRRTLAENRALRERGDALAAEVIELRHRLAAASQDRRATGDATPLTAWPRRIADGLRRRIRR